MRVSSKRYCVYCVNVRRAHERSHPQRLSRRMAALGLHLLLGAFSSVLHFFTTALDVLAGALHSVASGDIEGREGEDAQQQCLDHSSSPVVEDEAGIRCSGAAETADEVAGCDGDADGRQRAITNVASA